MISRADGLRLRAGDGSGAVDAVLRRDARPAESVGDGAWPEFQLGENVSLYLIDPTNIGQAFSGAALVARSRCACRTSQRRGAELEAKGVEFDGETFDTGVCHMAFFRDPDGTP